MNWKLEYPQTLQKQQTIDEKVNFGYLTARKLADEAIRTGGARMYWQAGMPGMATSGNANVDIWVANTKHALRLCEAEIELISDHCCLEMTPEHHVPKSRLHEQERKLASRVFEASNLSEPACSFDQSFDAAANFLQPQTSKISV